MKIADLEKTHNTATIRTELDYVFAEQHNITMDEVDTIPFNVMAQIHDSTLNNLLTSGTWDKELIDSYKIN